MIAEGYIEKVIFHNEENGYSVFTVETAGGEETLVGNVPGIAEGMFIQANGEYVHHPQYDIRFMVESFELSMPDDKEGIARFLGSGIIKGVGEALAKRIVKKFGDDTLRIIEEEPEKLAEVRGISKTMAEKIAVRYSENRSYRNVIMFLSKYGIGVKVAMKIYSEFGEQVYTIIRRNPYKIAERVPGIGFKTVDKIAMQSGVSEDSEFRVQSAALFILTQSMADGHMYLPEDELRNGVYDLLDPDMDIETFSQRFHGILVRMNVDRQIIMKLEGESSIVYTKWNYYTELNSAKLLLGLKFDTEASEDEVNDAIERVEKEVGIELAPEQKNAVSLAVQSGVSVITGGPGTGKTTIINAIIKYFEYQADVVYLAAPTGRAAKRITESTGYKARTIHRMLEFSGEPGEDGEKTALRFLRNKDNPLEADVVIIDEASMVDSNLFYSLLKAITPGTRLVLVGDTDQLPPVGAGNVLMDIISSDRFPVTILNKIFRQSDGSSIVTNAHKIKDGIHLEISNASQDFFFIPRDNTASVTQKCIELVLNDLPEYLNIPSQDIEVLTPMRRYDLGCEQLNKRLQAAMNPPALNKKEKDRGDIVFREGDKVMQIKNNYRIEWKIYANTALATKDERVADKNSGIIDQGVGVFNGDMGIISAINDFDELVEVTFDDGRVVEYENNMLDELEHSFAITVHKSQGSEYPAVVLPILNGMPKLMNRNLLYTAVTRAKRMVVIVGNPHKVNEMIDNVMELRRYTSFAERLRELSDAEDHDEYMALWAEDEEGEGNE